MELTVSVDGLDQVTSGMSVLEQQLPFAISRGINATLDSAQRAVRAHLHDGTFLLRRPEFIDRTIYIGRDDRARKDKLAGTVRVNPERNFLAKFEEGGQKDPMRAGSIAVPVFKQQSPSLVISRGDPRNIKRLMQSLSDQRSLAAGGNVGRLKFKGGKGRPKRLINGLDVFLVHTPRGTYLEERINGQRRILYAFRSAVPIKADLHFAEIALRTAEATWDENMGRALEEAIASAR